MTDVSRLKRRRTLGAPPPLAEASTNLARPEAPSPEPRDEPALAPPPPGPRPSGAAEVRVDGRSMRRTNRVVQFATRVTPEFDQRIRAIAVQEGLLIVEVLERALEAYDSKQPASL
jgi:hypothetical protein